MNKFFSKRSLLIAFVLFIGIVLLYPGSLRRSTAPATTTLIDIPTITPLRTQFNQDRGYARLILLVSPT